MGSGLVRAVPSGPPGRRGGRRGLRLPGDLPILSRAVVRALPSIFAPPSFGNRGVRAHLEDRAQRAEDAEEGAFRRACAASHVSVLECSVAYADICINSMKIHSAIHVDLSRWRTSLLNFRAAAAPVPAADRLLSH